MAQVFLIRLAITLMVFLIARGAYRWYWQRLESHSRKGALSFADCPTILFFTSPDCVICHSIQAPVLAIVEKRMADRLNIIEVDASLHTELAKDWKILSVPTLVVLNAEGKLAFINMAPKVRMIY